MKPLDRNYLLLQLKNFIYSKSASEFQSFFENIMDKTFPDFRRIPSGGGDGGNDGWIKEKGRYYQVYAPNVPGVRDSDAAAKLTKDFESLIKNWDQISEIKEYYFVYNDKYSGANKPEISISELEKKHPNVIFKLFLSKDLEKVFFDLELSDIAALGFDIDQINSVANAHKFLEIIEVELNKENSKVAYEILLNSKALIDHISNEELSTEFEVLECRCLRKLEKINESIAKYESINRRYPKNKKVLIALANIYFLNKNSDKSKECLEKVEQMDGKCPLLMLEKTIKRFNDGDEIDINSINLEGLSSKIKSNFYRVFAYICSNNGEYDLANSFIERALTLDPDRFNNHFAKLSIAQKILLFNGDGEDVLSKADELLNRIKVFESDYCDGKDIGFRNKLAISLVKLNAFRVKQDRVGVNKAAEDFYSQITHCHYDLAIEALLAEFLHLIQIPSDVIACLTSYLEPSKNILSEKISKLIIVQMLMSDQLFFGGVKFFDGFENKKYVDFISFLKEDNFEAVIEFVGEDYQFSLLLISCLRKFTDLKIKLVNFIPDEIAVKKEKVLFFVHYDEGNYDAAFSYVRQLDFSDVSYAESIPILDVIRKKEAWDIEAVLLENVIGLVFFESELYSLELQLFNSYLNLQRYSDVIGLGVRLLDKIISSGDVNYHEYVISNTIVACMERGKIDKSLFKKAKDILDRYKPKIISYDFNVKLEVSVYLKNNDEDAALKALIEGVKKKKNLSASEYAKLYFDLAINIAEKIDLNLDSLERVGENSFVKLAGKSKWYFIGDDNELDCVKITSEKPKYEVFFGKGKGDVISFNDPYGAGVVDEKIDIVYSIDKYILWRVLNDFHDLSNDGDMDGVRVIKMPEGGEPGDLSRILKYMEDSNEERYRFFNQYCESLFPLSVLAVVEGGLINAIGRIANEAKGFIHFCDGSIEHMDKQKKVARDVINGCRPFYIDGTSALFLSEVGLLPKIGEYLPNMKVPQSVINMLTNVADKFSNDDSHKGHLFVYQGKLGFSPVEVDRNNLVNKNIIKSIGVLESNWKNIENISLVNKADCFSERKIFAELCDSCILAQRENIPVLTEDYLYLTFNNAETGKAIPEYFSSLSLLRVLYDDGKIEFDEYLDYFGYLSSYRFRFLSLDANDIEKAVLGDGVIKKVDPKNIGKFNFRLTLAEDYGVTFESASFVIGGFIAKIIRDDSVTPDIIEKVLVEIMECISEKTNKSDFIEEIFNIVVSSIKNEFSNLVVISSNQLIFDKLNRIKQLLGVYSRPKIWVRH